MNTLQTTWHVIIRHQACRPRFTDWRRRRDQAVSSHVVAGTSSEKRAFASAEYCAAQIERDLQLLKRVESERARIYGADQFKNAIPGGDTGKVTITKYQLITDPANREEAEHADRRGGRGDGESAACDPEAGGARPRTVGGEGRAGRRRQAGRVGRDCKARPG